MSALWIHIFFALILNIVSSLCQHVDCVILDDGGFLLLSNQDDYISLVSFVCIAFLFFLPFPDISLLHSDCEEVIKGLMIQRSYDYGLLKLLKERGIFLGRFFHP